MAFSTQKDFFNVPFMNENVELDCKKACVKLKRYASTIDNRSWASDEAKQSKYLSDLVTCQYPSDRGDGECDIPSPDDQVARIQGITLSTADAVNAPKDPGTSGYTGKSKAKKQSEYGDSTAGGNVNAKKQNEFDDFRVADNKEELETFLGNLTGDDSLLECANVHLAAYQKVLNIKTTLEKQLEISNEHLKTAKEENKHIREILSSKLDSNTTKDFYNKIQKFTAAGKFNKNEENEMLRIHQKMENMNKAYEILQAENYYLKRLIDKLTARVALNKIITQPEKSKDIDYLQKEVNSLRKECLLLRQMEDEYHGLKQQQMNTLPTTSEQDAENIKSIIKERNSLREKCKSLKTLEQQVNVLKQQTQESKKEADGLFSSLNNQTQYINKMEGELQDMQKYYDDKNQKACFREECLKAQLEDLKDDLIRAKCEVQKANQLATEVSFLRNELLKRDLKLNDCDFQYKQLMDVVNELQSVKLQSPHDNETHIFKDQTEELAFYTCATLDEIIKELKKKGCFDNELMAAYSPGPEHSDTNVEYEKVCCQEMKRLQHQVDEMNKKNGEAANCEAIYEDALKRLEELETANAKLLNENQSLSGKLKGSEEKMATMLKKIENLNLEINKNGQETNKIGEDLQGAIELVKDISEVQLKNQQLVSAVSAINSRDDQKIIDDLHRQLEQEQSKLNKCQQDNVKLLEEAKVHEIDLKVLKDLNNKLEADRKKLWMDNNNLSNDNDNLKNMLNLIQPKGNSEIVDTSNNTRYNNTDQAFEYPDASQQKSTTDNLEKSTKSDSNEKNEQPSEDAALKQLSRAHPDNKTTFNSDDKTDKNAVFINNQEKSITSKQRQGGTKIKDTDKEEDTTQPQQNGKAFGDYKSSHKNIAYVQKLSHDRERDAALDDFVNKKSDSLKLNLQQGHCFEKEFRNILDDFARECSYCFCRLLNTKSKLYAIGHKLCHRGIDTLSFRELAYLHKKIYAQADQLLPGCLLDMILSDHKEQAKRMLTSAVMTRSVDNKNINLKISDRNVSGVDNKCCSCKNNLCCNNSQEMLQDKVHKLEKDIEIARQYLETLKNIPLEASEATENGDSTDTNNSTYRASSPVINPQKSRCSKHLTKLKARMTKHTYMYDL